MTLRLFEHPLSPYVRKVKIVLYEKGIAFDRELIAPMRREGDPNWNALATASPRGEVPALIDGEVKIFDSTVILDYIDEKWPEPPMLPQGAVARARVRMLEELCDGQLEAINWGLNEIGFFQRAEGEQAQSMRARAGEQFLRVWDRIERDFVVGPFIAGEAFGRADAALYPHVSGAAFFGFPLTDRHPKLLAWLAHCSGKASVQRDAGELVQAMQAGFGADGNMRSRQYRDHRLEWMFKVGARDVVLRGLDNGSIRLADDF